MKTRVLKYFFVVDFHYISENCSWTPASNKSPNDSFSIVFPLLRDQPFFKWPLYISLRVAI